MTRWSLLTVLVLAAGCGETEETGDGSSNLGTDPSTSDAAETGSAMPADSDPAQSTSSNVMAPGTVPPNGIEPTTPDTTTPDNAEPEPEPEGPANPMPSPSGSGTTPDQPTPTTPEPESPPMGQGGDATGGASGNGGMSTAEGGANAGEGGDGPVPEPEPLEGCEGGPLELPLDGCEPDFEETGDFYEDCVARINQFRWECQCLPPLDRWVEGEDCADQQAQYDYEVDEAHAGFRADICENGGSAQNECPGYGPNFGIVDYCLQQMWDEGPGEDFQAHGHYINMSNENFSGVACGIYEAPDGEIWSVQNFTR